MTRRPRDPHEWDISEWTFWLIVISVLILVTLAQVAFPAPPARPSSGGPAPRPLTFQMSRGTWPDQWSPEGRAPTKSMGGVIPATNGELYPIIVTLWNDGTEVYYIKGDGAGWRQIMVDPTPDERCGKAWIDFGMTPDGGGVKPRGDWTEPDCRWGGPFVEGCELKEQGVGA